ncbi:hypothetical protein OAB94_01840 [Flavobacteriaceae bacterium]|nr:hypothetical protein [Flavobacteriaceae bacterium]
MGSFKTSQGLRLETHHIDRLMRKAKENKIERMVYEHGYVFCEDCNRSGGVRIDCSHQISVKEAKESGRAELCYDVTNLKMLCRECHQKLDGLDLKFNKTKC